MSNRTAGSCLEALWLSGDPTTARDVTCHGCQGCRGCQDCQAVRIDIPLRAFSALLRYEERKNTSFLQDFVNEKNLASYFEVFNI